MLYNFYILFTLVWYGVNCVEQCSFVLIIFQIEFNSRIIWVLENCNTSVIPANFKGNYWKVFTRYHKLSHCLWASKLGAITRAGCDNSMRLKKVKQNRKWYKIYRVLSWSLLLFWNWHRRRTMSRRWWKPNRIWGGNIGGICALYYSTAPSKYIHAI